MSLFAFWRFLQLGLSLIKQLEKRCVIQVIFRQLLLQIRLEHVLELSVDLFHRGHLLLSMACAIIVLVFTKLALASVVLTT